jgi:flagellar protein FlaG
MDGIRKQHYGKEELRNGFVVSTYLILNYNYIKKRQSFSKKCRYIEQEEQSEAMGMAISNVNAVIPTGYHRPTQGSASGKSPPQAPSAQASQEPGPVSGEAANQVLQQIQSHLESMNISLSFSTYGEKGEDISVTVTDKNTGNVIREIPSKEIQALHTKLGELIGLLFNHSV